MNWIAVSVGIGDDVNVARLAARCGISHNEAIGAVMQIEVKLPKHARDGNIADIPDDLLERWANHPCSGRPGVFATAFRAIMCDDAGVVRTWEEMNGAAMRESDYDRDRKRVERERRRLEKKRAAEAERARLQAELELQDKRPGPDAPPSKPRVRSRDMQETKESAGRSAGCHTGGPPLTGRDVTTNPSMPDGMESPSAQPAGDAPSARNSEPPPLASSAPEWERALFADATPFEASAMNTLAAQGDRTAVLGLLHAYATGAKGYAVTGKFTGRPAEMQHVRTAVVEWVIERRTWNTDLFRAFVRTVADRREEPATAEARDIAYQQHAAQIASQVEVQRAALETAANPGHWRDFLSRPKEPVRRERPGKPMQPSHVGGVVATVMTA